MRTIEQIIKAKTDNSNRVAYLCSAIQGIIETTPQAVLTLSVNDVQEFKKLLQHVNYCVVQSDNLVDELLNVHSMSVVNYQFCLNDGEKTEAEKIQLLIQLVDAAIAFLPPETKGYIEAKKNRVLYEKGK